MISIRIFHQSINTILKKGLKIHVTEGASGVIAKKINTLLNTGHSPYIGYLDPDGRTIHIETSYFDPVLSVEVTKDSIHFIPLIDSDWHGAFFEILKILFLWEGAVIKKEEDDRRKKEKDTPDFDWI